MTNSILKNQWTALSGGRASYGCLIAAALVGVFAVTPLHADPPSPENQEQAKTVFMTPDKYDGALNPAPDRCGKGVAGADCICQWHADRMGVPGTYRAWISSSTVGPANDPEFSRHTGPYTRPDGTVIATSWNDLVDGSISAHIKGEDLVPRPIAFRPGENFQFVWTGTNEFGLPQPPYTQNCDDWSSAINAAGTMGVALSSRSTWTNGGLSDCSWRFNLYCFEQ